MENRRRKLIRWTSILVAAFTILLSVGSGMVAYSASQSEINAENEISNAYDQLEKAAIVHLLMQKVYACALNTIETVFYPEDAQAGEIFYAYDSDDAWLEWALSGSIDDQRIHCDETGPNGNILDLLAEYMEVDKTDILCNHRNNSNGGLIIRTDGSLNYDHSPAGHYNTVNNNCSTWDSDLTIGYVMNVEYEYGEDGYPTGYSIPYLYDLYEWYRSTSKNPYAQALGEDLSYYNPVDGYFLYMNDFEIMCNSDLSDTDKNSYATFSTPLTVINEKGEVEKRWIKLNDVNENSTFRTYISGKKSCLDLLNRMSEDDMVTGVQEALFGYIDDACTRHQKPAVEDIITQLQSIIDDPDASEESKQNATANLEIAQGYIDSNTFTKETEAGGLECIGSDELEGLTDIEQGESQNPGGSVTDPEDGGPDSSPTCFDGGGALGWILCPVIEGLGDAVEKVYEKVIEPFLRVDATLLSNSGSSGGTYGAWQTFQAIANIVFIILFLIVIFSQVTGVGIDNYGIKKILPKLIVAAILINLSYIICQLAVDISNVIGFSLKGLLDDMANGITINDVLGDPSANISMGATVLTVVVSVIAVGGAAGAILAGGMSFILPVLLALLSAFIAIMFVFILLGVRQAGVVLLVVISPLAFVCYMLPNTKKIFDRWLKIFQGLLLLYPICGLLMGGGNLASRILLSANSDSFLVALIAMLLNVIPFFFIPTLLRASFAAMGNIGAKITGVGRGINGTVNSRAKGSDYYKETQARRRAGLNSKGEVTRFGAFRAKYADSKLGNVLTLGGASRAKRSMARGRSEYLKNQSEHNRENLLMTDNYMKAAAARQAVDMEDEQIKTEEALIINSDDFNKDDKLREGLEAALLAGDSNKIRAYQNVLTRKGESGRQAVHQAMKNAEARGTVSDQARTAWASNIMNNYAKDYKANSRDTFSYAKDILRNGQTQSNGGVFTLSGNLASYEGRAEDAAKFTDEALAGMDDDAFVRYNNNGNISQEAAYRALHNENARNLMQDQRVRALEAIAGAYQPADVASQSDQAELSLRLQHEQIAATQGAVGGQFQGRNIYRTPTGFNAVRRETNRNGDLIMVNDKGERWNSHKGIYER